MRIKHLLSTCLLLGSLASCTSDQVLPHEGGEINGNVPAQGAVVFSLEGLGSGSVVNPATRADVLATSEENRIDSLDIYVFAYDDNGTFDEDLKSTDPAVIDQLTPQSEAEVYTSQNKWYLQEKWTWKNPESGHSSGKVDTSLPQLHEIAQLGGSGVARTATIYPQEGRYLRFFIVANGGELTQAGTDDPWKPVFTTTDATGATTPGTTAADFLKLRIRLGARPLGADQVLPISCPLPMTAQMANTVADCVNMTAAASPVKVTRSAVLTRAVTRFDIVNRAALPSQGDYTLTDVIINGQYAYTNMKNEVPAADPLKPAVKVNLESRTWENYNHMSKLEGKLLKSAFYTSPTLGGTDPMTLGLRGVLGQSSAQPGELLTRLNKDVKVVNGQGAAIQLKANYRYLINIQKLGSDVNVAFSILDWDSRVLDADFSNAPMPILMCENAQGITWSVSDKDMNQHLVTMANTAVGGRLAFGLGTYNADEMADLLLYPDDPTKIPFEATVLSLNTDPSLPLDNTWLGKPVITFDPLKRDRFTVTLDVRPEAQVPLYARPDLLVKVWNKEHREKEIFFRVTSTWTTPERPEAAMKPIVTGNRVYEVNGYYVTAPNADEMIKYQWSTIESAQVMDTDPCAGHGKWRMPTMKDFEAMAGWQQDWPWSQAQANFASTIKGDALIEQFKAAFPNSWYWSSVSRTADNNAWFFSSDPDSSKGIYSWSAKTEKYAVRCIWDDTLK